MLRLFGDYAECNVVLWLSGLVEPFSFGGAVSMLYFPDCLPILFSQ